MLKSLPFTEILFTKENSVQIRDSRTGKQTLMGPEVQYGGTLSRLNGRIQEEFKKRDNKARNEDQSEAGRTKTENHFTAEETIAVEHDEVKLHIRRVLTRDGAAYSCRRPIENLVPFNKIPGMDSAARLEIVKLATNHESGLIIFAGRPGSGKSLTAMSCYTNMAETEGDIGVYITRFPQLDISGPTRNSRGATLVFEEPGDIHDLHSDIEKILSLRPRHAIIEEISSPIQMKLAIELSNAGVLVVSTIAATSIIAAVDKMILAGDSAYGSLDAARNAIASSLRTCIFQEQEKTGNLDENNMRKLNTEYLFVASHNSDTISASKRIRAGQIANLVDVIRNQTRQIKSGSGPLSSRERSAI